jgi:ubiquinone/menaquinone biosynthesis C-methylase UbiE
VYDAMASSYEQHVRGSAYNAHYERPALLSLLGNLQGKHVLDAGCGPGYYFPELVARGATIVGIDASEQMVALASRHSSGGVSVQRAVLGEPLPFLDHAFDLVLCALAIHYVENQTAAFGEFFRVLKPGGVAVLSTHHPTHDWRAHGGSYFDLRQETEVWKRDAVEYEVRYWRRPLTATCAAAADSGFLIERLVEPMPAESMREHWPDTWSKLQREPAFLLLQLLRPVSG